jgi:hypothetical protein
MNLKSMTCSGICLQGRQYPGEGQSESKDNRENVLRP